MRRPMTAERKVWARLRLVGVILYGLFILLPIAYMVIVSLTPDAEVGGRAIFPSHVAWGNYRLMWFTVHLAHDIVNSVIISGCSGLLATVIALPASYLLSRFRFRGRKPFMISLITMQTIPQVMLLLPLFAILVIIQNTIQVHLIGSYFTIIITYLTFSLPFACWLLILICQICLSILRKPLKLRLLSLAGSGPCRRAPHSSWDGRCICVFVSSRLE